ncbi:Alpha/Beta hydrolase protein [Penicillium macrosclerotiorum]|uniref:Alpha/Beta hydrolase protein n=1 Tax=Penicillium macrosclerotiorum TaxID=303699 RepID=UPI002546CD9E|nr:Alpha/Beta hydrolase protein [Penicillium macrosclerotiorum]KAJ5692655.1 Alpha/Beta hydrolase protein [Penicillium macrosclerotiorum]
MANLEKISLLTKPKAQISYAFHSSTSTSSPALVVFLNGLGLPQVAWNPTISILKETNKDNGTPAMLTYDRFGQGQTTDRDPNDENAADPMHGHDTMSAVQDLRQLVTQIAQDRMEISDIATLPIVFVANSLGCAIARLYAQEYPGTVAGLLLLDSVLANSDFVSIFPDPDSEGFDVKSIPSDITPDSLRGARERARRIFHPDVGSKEGLSRKNLRDLLPASDAPALKGPGGRGPFVTVVGNDFEAFAEESSKMGVPKPITLTYSKPYWQKYNEGLAKITEVERSKGPLIAPGAGHFIQKDNPQFVAQELAELLLKAL